MTPNVVANDNDHFIILWTWLMSVPYLEPLLETGDDSGQEGWDTLQMAGTGRARVAGAASKLSFSFMYLAPQWRRLEGWAQPRLVEYPHAAFPAQQPWGSQTSYMVAYCGQWPFMT